MHYQWQFQPYRRRFQPALQTSHGLWTLRDGILVRLLDEAGKVGWGEIAPIAWFGSETLEQALAFCHQLPSALSDELIFAIPDALPCCQFGFESAWEGMQEQAIEQSAPQRRRDAESKVQSSTLQLQNSLAQLSKGTVAVQNSKLQSQGSTPDYRPISPPLSLLSPLPSLPQSALLPVGKAALYEWQSLWEKGFRTFKWKIGVQAIATELALLHELIQRLPTTATLRLDANGGLSRGEAMQWLQACDAMIGNPNRTAMIEYLEQPLAVDQFQAMQDLSRCYQTPIALDESVATLQQLQTCHENGWRGVFVIKPAIVGFPHRLRQFCQQRSIDAVFSSAFETAIGRQAGLQLAAALGNPKRAMGYGTTHWFGDTEITDFKQLWQTL